MTEMITKIDAIIGTMNNIEVHRKHNLMALAGCIGILEEINTELKQRESDKHMCQECDI